MKSEKISLKRIEKACDNLVEMGLLKKMKIKGKTYYKVLDE